MSLNRTGENEKNLDPELSELTSFVKPSQSTITCSKLTRETLKQGVKYVQS